MASKKAPSSRSRRSGASPRTGLARRARGRVGAAGAAGRRAPGRRRRPARRPRRPALHAPGRGRRPTTHGSGWTATRRAGATAPARRSPPSTTTDELPRPRAGGRHRTRCARGRTRVHRRSGRTRARVRGRDARGADALGLRRAGAVAHHPHHRRRERGVVAGRRALRVRARRGDALDPSQGRRPHRRGDLVAAAVGPLRGSISSCGRLLRSRRSTASSRERVCRRWCRVPGCAEVLRSSRAFRNTFRRHPAGGGRDRRR